MKNLECCFSDNSKEYVKNYLSLNKDISIIKDYSSGSNATTVLCSKDGKMFFRKYMFGKDCNKLYEQVEWIKNHNNILPLTHISNVKNEANYCSYDMPYNDNAISFFNYIHSNNLEVDWNLLKKIFEDLDLNLHTLNIRPSKEEAINEYINKKVLNNIKKIEKFKDIKDLLKYEDLLINGKKYKNLSYFKKYLSLDYLYNVFKYDSYSDIHGDLTIENIICIKNSKSNYYIIDPNLGNIHDSPNLDYAKVLQSLHGGYEFLMNTKNVDIYENCINFLSTKSLIYEKLFEKTKNYLESKYDRNCVKSIFFHEIIHYLRLLPYKINKDGRRAIIFYSELIIVLNDVINFYCKGEK